MSLRIAPPSSHATTTSNTSHKPTNLPKGAPSAPGLPDTIRSSSTSQTTTITTTAPTSSTHPLESRLTAWQAAQDALKLEMLRRTYGIAEPIRRGMELKIVRGGEWRPAVLGGEVASVHDDVLNGRDAEVCWEDVYTDAGRVEGGSEAAGGAEVLDEMEGKVGMGKW